MFEPILFCTKLIDTDVYIHFLTHSDHQNLLELGSNIRCPKTKGVRHWQDYCCVSAQHIFLKKFCGDKLRVCGATGDLCFVLRLILPMGFLSQGRSTIVMDPWSQLSTFKSGSIQFVSCSRTVWNMLFQNTPT